MSQGARAVHMGNFILIRQSLIMDGVCLSGYLWKTFFIVMICA